MEIENICCENGTEISLWDSYEESLLAALKGSVFHLTSQHAFNLIRKTEAIEHNKDGRFPINTASEKSFGRQKGWVCFFDLRNATLETVKDTYENRYNFLRPPGDFRRKLRENSAEYSLAYLILGSKHYDRLIPYKKFNEFVGQEGTYPMAVPKVETWIDNRVPITWIEKVILADIRELVPPPRNRTFPDSPEFNFRIRIKIINQDY